MKKQKLTKCLLTAGLCVMLGIAGCGGFHSGDLTNSTESREDLIAIGFSQLGSESVWRTANTASIQAALTRENGFFLMFHNARQKQENQIKALRSFISQRVDYIVFAPVTESGWDTVLQEAKDADIPVILVDRMVDVSDESLYEAFVGTDKEEEGRKAGEWLASYLEELGKEQETTHIVVLQGPPGSTAVIGRTQGFREIAEEHENWIIMEERNADFTTAKGKEVMQLFLKKYPEIDVVVCQNDDMAFGALEALEEAGAAVGTEDGIAMISFDGGRKALELVKEGKINVDIECNPEQGEALKEIVEALEQGQSVTKINNIEEKVFTADNVEDYIEDRTY